MAPSFFETKRYGSVSAKMCHFIRNGVNDDTILLKKHIVWYCRCFCLYGTLFAQRIATSYRKKRKPTRNGSCRLLMFSVRCGECGYDCLFYQTRTGRNVLRKTYKRRTYIGSFIRSTTVPDMPKRCRRLPAPRQTSCVCAGRQKLPPPAPKRRPTKRRLLAKWQEMS